MPESPCGRSRAFRPLARSAHGRPERCGRRGGRDCLEARGGLTGQPRASRRSPVVPAAHPANERAKHPGTSRRRPRHFARSAGRGRAKARPRRRRGRAGGIPRSVRGAAAAFRPLAVTTRGPAGTVRQAGWKRPPGGAGRPAGVAAGLQAVACTACGSRDRRAGGTSGCARKTTAAFRPLADRTRGTGDRAPATEHRARARAAASRHGRGRAQRHVREARRAGIGSRTWQPRMTASSGSTAR